MLVLDSWSLTKAANALHGRLAFPPAAPALLADLDLDRLDEEPAARGERLRDLAVEAFLAAGCLPLAADARPFLVTDAASLFPSALGRAAERSFADLERDLLALGDRLAEADGFLSAAFWELRARAAVHGFSLPSAAGRAFGAAVLVFLSAEREREVAVDALFPAGDFVVFARL